MDEPISPEHDAYLREHVWALLCTTRGDGSPQSSMVAYQWDGTDLIVSTRASSAKVRNLRRRPVAVAAVADDRRFLSVAGPVTIVDSGPELLALTLQLQGALQPSDAASLQRDLDAGLEAVGRVVVVLTPERILGRI